MTGRLQHLVTGQRHGESAIRLGTAEQSGQKGVARLGRQLTDPPLHVGSSIGIGQPARHDRASLKLSPSHVNRLAIRTQRQRLTRQQRDPLRSTHLHRIRHRGVNRTSHATAHTLAVALATAIHQHRAAGLLSHHAQHLQVESRTNAVTVNWYVAVAEPHEHLLHVGNIDQLGTAHAVANVQHAAGSFFGYVGYARNGLRGRFQGRDQSSRTQRSTTTQTSNRLANRLRIGTRPLGSQRRRLHVNGKQADPVGCPQRTEYILEHGQRLHAMRAGLAGRGVDQDHHVAGGIRPRCVRRPRSHQRQSEVGLAVWGRVPHDVDGLLSHNRRSECRRRGGHQDQGCPQGHCASQPHAETPEFKGETISMGVHIVRTSRTCRPDLMIQRDVSDWSNGRDGPRREWSRTKTGFSPAIVTRFSEWREEKSATLTPFRPIPHAHRLLHPPSQSNRCVRSSGRTRRNDHHRPLTTSPAVSVNRPVPIDRQNPFPRGLAQLPPSGQGCLSQAHKHKTQDPHEVGDRHLRRRGRLRSQSLPPLTGHLPRDHTR